MAYFSLFVVSFLAATILPMSSELTLAGLLSTNNYTVIGLLSSASIGNILGSILNWLLGFFLFKHINKNWLPFKKKQINNAAKKFKKFGVFSLLFAWLPVVGDPLTFVAGILRVNFLIFLILVSVGKISRYFFVYILIN